MSMIYISVEETEKFKLIDKFIKAISQTELNTLVEADLLVDRLKTAAPINGDQRGPIQTILESHNVLEADVMMLRTELYSLKADLSIILKFLVKPTDSYVVNEINNMKSRHGIY